MHAVMGDNKKTDAEPRLNGRHSDSWNPPEALPGIEEYRPHMDDNPGDNHRECQRQADGRLSRACDLRMLSARSHETSI